MALGVCQMVKILDNALKKDGLDEEGQRKQKDEEIA